MSQTYSKSSFDRFGDDLSEVVLSYLSFEDSFRAECVSKQFQRCVHQKQYELIIDNKISHKLIDSENCVSDKVLLNLRAFESIVRKCRYIQFIQYSKVYTNQNQMFDLIIRFCSHLNAIDLDLKNLSDETIERFFQTFGPNLKKIIFKAIYCNFNKNNLKICPNLQYLDVLNQKDLSNIFDNNNEILFKKLKKIRFRFTDEDSNRLELIVKNNNNSLESVYVFIGFGCTQTAVHQLLEQLANLRRLRHLAIIFNYTTTFNQSFALLLKQMVNNCRNLKSLRIDLKLEFSTQIPLILNAIKDFRQLKRLDLRLVSMDFRLEITDSDVFCESLKECQNLTHLTLNYNQLNDRFFTDIGIHLPKLEFLNAFRVNAKSKEFIFCSLKQLLKLRELRLDYLYGYNSDPLEISDSFVTHFMNESPIIEKFYLFGKTYLKNH